MTKCCYTFTRYTKTSHIAALTSSVATTILPSTFGASLQAISSSSWKLSCRDILHLDRLLELKMRMFLS